MCAMAVRNVQNKYLFSGLTLASCGKKHYKNFDCEYDNDDL